MTKRIPAPPTARTTRTRSFRPTDTLQRTDWEPFATDPQRFVTIRNTALCAADGSRPALTERGEANLVKTRALKQMARDEGRMV
jgi:hypothetical protein